MAAKVAVVGAGSWGTAAAAVAAGRGPTVLWARRDDLADEITARHTNATYLPGAVLPSDLQATSSLAVAGAGAELIVMAVPSHGFREVLEALAPAIAPGVPIVSLTKGFEQGSHLRMTEVASELVASSPAGVLTGPNLAKEIMAGHPAASVVAFSAPDVAAAVQARLSTAAFRIYTNPDVVGCETAGALKNVMAIAAGIADGLGLGDNTKAALITRGLAELSRLGVALGGRPLTFSGLAGMGDLVATCMSRQSRNRHVGEELGRGKTMVEILAESPMVAEGVKTSKVVLQLAASVGVEMPIVEEVVAVVHGGKRPEDVMRSLLQRQAGGELDGIAG